MIANPRADLRVFNALKFKKVHHFCTIDFLRLVCQGFFVEKSSANFTVVPVDIWDPLYEHFCSLVRALNYYLGD